MNEKGNGVDLKSVYIQPPPIVTTCEREKERERESEGTERE